MGEMSKNCQSFLIHIRRKMNEKFPWTIDKMKDFENGKKYFHKIWCYQLPSTVDSVKCHLEAFFKTRSLIDASG